ncbi:hypothetical protein B0J14DRAFT_175404 [Halenospora varia]|nr:hypothetical protein B0J14DRAFT_175404 [Halenospora varia]
MEAMGLPTLSVAESAIYEILLEVGKRRRRTIPIPRVVIITDLAKYYDDLAAMVMLKELDRLNAIKLLNFHDSLTNSIANAESLPTGKRSYFRRGRGCRKRTDAMGSDDPEDPDFFTRDFEFRSSDGSPNLARCRLDSQCHIPFIVSEHWAQENGKMSDIIADFKDPGVQSVSGHKLQLDGILRNMIFNVKGSTVSYRRDVYVCKQLNNWTDMIAGAKFMAEQFAVLFSKTKKMFAGIFSSRREKQKEKVQGQTLQMEADRGAVEQERKRQIKKAKEAREKEEARRVACEEAQLRQNNV